MASPPSALPSPQARRQAQQLGLQAAVASRDQQLVTQLLGQWVHRHGVSSLANLWAELNEVEPEGCAWWHDQGGVVAQPKPSSLDLQSVPTEVPASSSAVRSLPLEAKIPPATRPAPAPSHPTLVQLRAWLPDQESRRAA